MREILFRGQHRKHGQKVNMAGEKLPSIWVYGGIFPGTGDYSIIYGAKNESFTGAEIEKWTVYSDTVGQYTGLTDKNGKKIFEGDIVDFDGCAYVCEWDEGNIEFALENETEKFGICYAYPNIEVIGNIHDNPELLEGGADNGI